MKYAELIEKAVKEKKAGAPKVNKGNPFKRASKAIVRFCKDFKGEMTVTIPVGSSATVFLPGIENPRTLVQGTHKIKF